MKTLTKLMIGVCLIMTTLYSCNDDVDDSDTTNYLSVEGTEYQLNQGLIYDFKTKFTDDANFFNIKLLSDGFTITETDTVDYSVLLGTGDKFEIQLYSDTKSDDIVEGDYTYASSNGAGTFIIAGYVMNFDTETGTSDSYYSISSGTISIEKDESQYIIKIDCTDKEGNAIAGYYKGYLDFSDCSEVE